LRGPKSRVVKLSAFFQSFAVAALGAFAFAAASCTSAAAQATPPPTPPPITAPPSATEPDAEAPLPAMTTTPIPVPSGFGLPGASPGKGAAARPSPPPPQRKGIEGVWEVAIQRGANTVYTHFNLHQDGNVLSGTYRDNAGKKYPINGSVDGQQVRLIVSLTDGTTILLQGKLDGTTDMIGVYTAPKETAYFTAAWRPKEKWIDNVNAAPGGLGPTTGGGTPP